MPAIHTEGAFETTLERWLLEHGGYAHADAAGFDRERALLPSEFVAFVRETQPERWKGLERQHGTSLEHGLVEQLVKDCATGADTLPLLSLTLERLYHDFGSDGDLRLDEYIALGGMGNIIRDKIEKVLDPDPLKRKQQLALLRTAFIPWLVTINPQNDEPMRRLAHRSDLPEDSLSLVDALVENAFEVGRLQLGAHAVERRRQSALVAHLGLGGLKRFVQLLLRAAPAAMEYYPRVGFQLMDNAFIHVERDPA